jgi:hypothetical protein
VCRSDESHALSKRRDHHMLCQLLLACQRWHVLRLLRFIYGSAPDIAAVLVCCSWQTEREREREREREGESHRERERERDRERERERDRNIDNDLNKYKGQIASEAV